MWDELWHYPQETNARPVLARSLSLFLHYLVVDGLGLTSKAEECQGTGSYSSIINSNVLTKGLPVFTLELGCVSLVVSAFTNASLGWCTPVIWHSHELALWVVVLILIVFWCSTNMYISECVQLSRQWPSGCLRAWCCYPSESLGGGWFSCGNELKLIFTFSVGS